nr:MAG TPA: hypothetical protein [Caudoviricetes sp.]
MRASRNPASTPFITSYHKLSQAQQGQERAQK